MCRRFRVSSYFAAGLIAIGSVAFAETVDLVPTDRDLRVQDLANLAEAIGVKFGIYDYETIEPHCVHFFVDEIDTKGTKTRHDGNGLCGIAGPHRITVQWNANGGEIGFTFMRYRRDIEQGGSVSGPRPRLPIPEGAGFSLYQVAPTALRTGQETLLIHGSYGWNEGPQMEFKVIAELRENPTAVIGTE